MARRATAAVLLAIAAPAACAASSSAVPPPAPAPEVATAAPAATPSAAPAPVPSAEPAPTQAPIASAAPTTTPEAKPPPGPPPQPPQGVAWSMFAPAFGRHPTARSALALGADGNVSYESSTTGSGEGGSDPLAQSPSAQCRGHLDPALHRRLVVAAQAALATSCTKGANRRGETQWSLEVHLAGGSKRCAVKTDTPAYAAFEKVLEEAQDKACR